MTDPTITSQLANAIPILIGGLLAIAGGLGSQLVIHWLTESREHAKLRRERLEALVKALYAHEQWVDDKKNKMIFRIEDHDDPAPLNEIKMIQALHFPELAKEVNAVQQAYIPMLKFIHEQKIAHMKDQQAFIASWNTAPYDEAYKQHLVAAKALTEKCRSLLLN
jgi:hypothetical protein